MENYPLCSGESSGATVVNELQSSVKEHPPVPCSEIECLHLANGASSVINNNTIEPLFTDYCPRSVETSNDKICLSGKELVTDLSSFDHHVVHPSLQRTSEIGSSSCVEQQSPLLSNEDNCDAKSGGSEISQEVSSSSSSHQGVGSSRERPLHSLANRNPCIHAFDSTVTSSATDSSFSPQSGVENAQEAAPPGPEFFMLDRETERNNEGVLQVDVVSISSSTLFGSTGEVSHHEARRNSRRLFWDAFSRRSSRRHSDSRTIVFSSEDTDDLGSHDRWLLDFSGDLFEDGLSGDSGILGSRHRGTHDGRWHSRSEIWERFRGGLDESSRRTTFCASGLHPDGTCSCESFLTAEESSTRGSISRIVMLAEALFEVLDEIHRQPISLSLSMVSHPAPESVVNSFPLKCHNKPNTAEDTNQDVEQCYICLAEYEEGDKIRVLPCRHEYHMSCVDKWLKEIHGVCPLCRGDVCAGLVEGSISTS
ncbi:E3 ubiquitin ligase big brother-related-like [Thalictrum thalictroides]|uniref:E3 ubiquitin ligase big brother-related-like n=1 Tax=Thalictrum thalictroides TaxID=46969 RepID=A0A7J6UVK8_THATH|nr:E3 ubiquitin ligase big brother-related-like [Thalictrum thalictroides]